MRTVLMLCLRCCVGAGSPQAMGIRTIEGLQNLGYNKIETEDDLAKFDQSMKWDGLATLCSPPRGGRWSTSNFTKSSSFFTNPMYSVDDHNGSGDGQRGSSHFYPR